MKLLICLYFMWVRLSPYHYKPEQIMYWKHLNFETVSIEYYYCFSLGCYWYIGLDIDEVLRWQQAQA